MYEATAVSDKQERDRKRRLRNLLIFLLFLLPTICYMAWLLRFWLWVLQENKGIDAVLQGNLAKGRIEGERAISMMSVLPDKKSFAQSLRFLYLIHACRRQFSKAENYTQQLLVFEKNSWGERSPEYACTLCDLALIYRKERRYAESEALYKQAIVIYSTIEAQLAEKARMQALLAWVLIRQSKLAEAKNEIESADKILIKKFGENHFERLVGLVERAYIAREEGRQNDFQGDIDKAYKIATEPKLESSSAQTVVVLNLLAQMFSECQQSDKALRLFEIAEENCKASVFAGTCNTYMSDILEPHAKLLAKLGRNQDSSELLKRSSNIRSM